MVEILLLVTPVGVSFQDGQHSCFNLVVEILLLVTQAGVNAEVDGIVVSISWSRFFCW